MKHLVLALVQLRVRWGQGWISCIGKTFGVYEPTCWRIPDSSVSNVTQLYEGMFTENLYLTSHSPLPNSMYSFDIHDSLHVRLTRFVTFGQGRGT